MGPPGSSRREGEGTSDAAVQAESASRALEPFHVTGPLPRTLLEYGHMQVGPAQAQGQGQAGRPCSGDHRRLHCHPLSPSVLMTRLTFRQPEHLYDQMRL